MSRKGTLYGTGVGPGDPMLMTLKAVRVIEGCDVIAVPTEKKEESVAYRIASGVADLKEKHCMEISMPMTRDTDMLVRYHRQGVEQIKSVLDLGQDVAFLTLGDPTIYSTYMYLHRKIAGEGYRTEIISGVPSFCAAAASLNISLTERSDQLHVIPASYAFAEAVGFAGTKVFMKAGSRLEELKKVLKEADAEVYMVENCGMEQEKKYFTAEEIDGQAGYYATVIAKERG